MRALYDYFEGDVDKAIAMHNSITSALQTNWKSNFQKQRKITRAIYQNISLYSDDEDEKTIKVDEVFNIIERLDEYDM